jgi:hypothetical protein
MEIYERIEARLIALEKLTGDLEHKLQELEALAKIVNRLERKLRELGYPGV